MFALFLAVILSVAAIFPTDPTLTIFRTRDFAGKPFPDVRVRSTGGKLRLEAFGKVFVYTGETWFADRPLAREDSGAVAFLAPFEPESRVARADASGRPTVLVDVPAGARKARVEYRYDADGLASANLVFADGTGFQFRKTSSEPGVFPPSDFEPPREVGPPPLPGAPGASVGLEDRAAVDRLFALAIAESEQRDFERAGGVGRFRPRSPR